MSTKYLLGIDIGTYSSKGVLVDVDGTVIASHVVPHDISMPLPGHFEQDADEVWWSDFVRIVNELLTISEIKPIQIEGVGVSAIGPCILPIDEHGKPLRPGILYGIDTRASAEIIQLEQTFGKDKIFEKAAVNLDTQAAGPKILWIKNNEPEVYKKTRWFLTSHSYLVYKLTGIASIDIYTACTFSPLFDLYNLSWHEDFASHIAPIHKLPKPYWSCNIVGKVNVEAARITGLAVGTPVTAGTIDACAEAVSSGVSKLGDMMLMFGSSIFFILKTAELNKTKNFWCANFLEKDTFSVMGGMSTSGSLTTWFRNQFAKSELENEAKGGENAYSILARQAGEAIPGANGIIALPYFEGERTPLHDPTAKGVLFGLSLKHTRSDIYRAILESVGYGIRHNLEAMQINGVYPKKIMAVGGGTQNDLWMQIVADIANIEFIIPKQSIGACYGDAFMAGVGIGLFNNLTENIKWVSFGKSIKPNSAIHRIYKDKYRIYLELYESTKHLMKDLRNTT